MTIYQVLSGQIPYHQCHSACAVIIAVIVTKQRPPKEPATSPSGKSYLPLWEVAEDFWHEDPDQRPEIQEAHNRLILSGFKSLRLLLPIEDIEDEPDTPAKYRQSAAPLSTPDVDADPTIKQSDGGKQAGDRRPAEKVIVDDFEMMRVLGKGRAGKVLLVKYKKTEDLYALKAIPKRHVLAHQELQHTLTEQAVLERMSRERSNWFVGKLWWSFHDRIGTKTHREDPGANSGSDADIFDGYSFKGRHTVLIDDENYESYVDEKEDDDEIFESKGVAEALANMNADVKPLVKSTEGVFESGTIEQNAKSPTKERDDQQLAAPIVSLEAAITASIPPDLGKGATAQREEDNWHAVKSPHGENQNGAKAPSLWQRGVVDRYRLAVFRKSGSPYGSVDRSSIASETPDSPTASSLLDNKQRHSRTDTETNLRRSTRGFFRAKSQSSDQSVSDLRSDNHQQQHQMVSTADIGSSARPPTTPRAETARASPRGMNDGEKTSSLTKMRKYTEQSAEKMLSLFGSPRQRQQQRQ